jgi:GrpB-like predicted nucleotidyltransferase (UPF0157 family)/GNAT superfamily N-acetyltransferase
MLLRARVEEDLHQCDVLARVVQEADGYPPFLPAGDLRGFLLAPEALAAWIAEEDGQILGHVSLHSHSSAPVMALASEATGRDGQALGFVARLLVRPDVRRRGIGRALLQKAAGAAVERGLWPVLDVATRFTGAIAMYEAAGWRRAGTVTVSFGDGTSLEEHVFVANSASPLERRPDPTLEIVPYDPSWPIQFEHERALLAEALPSAVSIEHIGSTSVPGLSGKPTLDILVVLPIAEEALERAQELAVIGYDHQPGSFAEEGDHLFFRKVVNRRRKAHLHVLSASSPKPAEYRLFREFLVACPGFASRYEAEKLGLAERLGYDRAAYVAAKQHVVEKLLEDARSWRLRKRPTKG